jgi:hypothetical protein
MPELSGPASVRPVPVEFLRAPPVAAPDSPVRWRPARMARPHRSMAASRDVANRAGRDLAGTRLRRSARGPPGCGAASPSGNTRHAASRPKSRCPDRTRADPGYGCRVPGCRHPRTLRPDVVQAIVAAPPTANRASSRTRPSRHGRTPFPQIRSPRSLEPMRSVPGDRRLPEPGRTPAPRKSSSEQQGPTGDLTTARPYPRSAWTPDRPRTAVAAPVRALPAGRHSVRGSTADHRAVRAFHRVRAPQAPPAAKTAPRPGLAAWGWWPGRRRGRRSRPPRVGPPRQRSST